MFCLVETATLGDNNAQDSNPLIMTNADRATPRSGSRGKAGLLKGT